MQSFAVVSTFFISIVSPFYGLLLLIVGFFAGDRVFAHWHLATSFVPIYITEAVIFGLLIARILTISFKHKMTVFISTQTTLFLLLVVVAQSFIRGIFNPSYPFPIVMRDFAIAYYFFCFIVLANFQLTVFQWKLSGFTLLLVLLAQSFLLLMGNFIPFVRYSQSAALAMYLSLGILMLVCFEIQERWLNWCRYGCLIIFSTSIAYLMVRTSWLSLILILVFLIGRYKSSSWSRVIFTRLFSVLGVGYFFCFCLAGLPTSLISTTALNKEVFSFTQGKQSPNVLTRINMWIDAYEQVTGTGMWQTPPKIYRLLKDPHEQFSETGIAKYYSNPNPTSISDSCTEILIPTFRDPRWVRVLFGIPFGHPYLPLRCNIQTSRFDPHNSYVAWFYRTGVIGLILFVTFLIIEIRKILTYIEESTGSTRSIAIGLLLGILYCMGHALSDVTFENAYKGIFIAVFIGLLRSMRRSNVPQNQ